MKSVLTVLLEASGTARPDQCADAQRLRAGRRACASALAVLATAGLSRPLETLAAPDDRRGREGKPGRPDASGQRAPRQGKQAAPASHAHQAGGPAGAAQLPASIGALSADSIRRAMGAEVRLLSVGAKPLPPGIAKNLARGKPLPPGIARQSVPSGVVARLPRIDGYDWVRIGTTLVLVGVATQIVEAVIDGVFN